MKTTENNKLIADFMSVEKSYVDNLGTQMYKNPLDKREDICGFKYHESWDWLMPVVSKCYEINIPNDSNLHGDISCELLECDLEETYKAVVEFIDWYNCNNEDDEKRFICGNCGEHVSEYTYNEDKDIDECNKCKEN